MKETKKGIGRFPIVLIVVIMICAALKLWVFSPQRMIIGTWVYDSEESYMFDYGRQLEMIPLYSTLSFANQTQMTNGEAYYFNDKELGIKPFGNHSYHTYEVESFTPNELVLRNYSSEHRFSHLVYRKK